LGIAPETEYAVVMRSKSAINPTRLAVSLLVTLVVTAPAAYLAAPHVKRWMRIHWLTSTDPDQRRRGLEYVAGLAGDDPRVLAAAVQQLRVVEDANFRQIVGALQAAGCWRRQRVGDGPWLRWIGLLANEPDTEAGSLAAQRLAGLYDLAGDPRVVGLLGGLLGRDEPDVRYNALCAAAELAMSAADRSPYERMIADRTRDAEPLIVRHAWLFSHYLDMPADNAPAWLAGAVESVERPHHDEARFTLEQIRALLLSPEAPLRDVGCVLAVRELEADQLDALVAELLGDLNDRAKMSGAVLSGMTGLHTDLLARRAESADDWAVGRVLGLGLWMQDGGGDFVDQTAGWFMRDDLPHSTLLLALLHGEATRWRALDYLLNPRGESPTDLPALLDDYGWWRVLEAYLPASAPHWQPGTPGSTPGSAPGSAPGSPTAPPHGSAPGSAPGAKQLQLDMLRDWYLVHRKRLMDGS
jgi:hypothetical protein